MIVDDDEMNMNDDNHQNNVDDNEGNRNGKNDHQQSGEKESSRKEKEDENENNNKNDGDKDEEHQRNDDQVGKSNQPSIRDVEVMKKLVATRSEIVSWLRKFGDDYLRSALVGFWVRFMVTSDQPYCLARIVSTRMRTTLYSFDGWESRIELVLWLPRANTNRVVRVFHISSKSFTNEEHSSLLSCLDPLPPYFSPSEILNIIAVRNQLDS